MALRMAFSGWPALVRSATTVRSGTLPPMGMRRLRCASACGKPRESLRAADRARAPCARGPGSPRRCPPRRSWPTRPARWSSRRDEWPPAHRPRWPRPTAARQRSVRHRRAGAATAPPHPHARQRLGQAHQRLELAHGDGDRLHALIGLALLHLRPDLDVVVLERLGGPLRQARLHARSRKGDVLLQLRHGEVALDLVRRVHGLMEAAPVPISRREAKRGASSRRRARGCAPGPCSGAAG
jgi:hypothetical protein